MFDGHFNGMQVANAPLHVASALVCQAGDVLACSVRAQNNALHRNAGELHDSQIDDIGDSALPEDAATVGKTLHRIGERTVRAEVDAVGFGFVFVASGDFLRHPEDTRTNIVFKNPTPVDEFVLKFRRP